MGRRLHHGRHHGRGPRPTRPRGAAAGRPAIQAPPGAPATPVEAPAPGVEASTAIEPIEDSPSVQVFDVPTSEEPEEPSPAVETDPVETDPVEPARVVPDPVGTSTRPEGREPGGGGCTTSQLRRFIRSRPYVPLHELRRRFALNGGEDDVAVVEVNGRRVYVGLPERERRMLGELLRGGEVGYELSLDPVTPVVVGVYPMRPVSRI